MKVCRKRVAGGRGEVWRSGFLIAGKEGRRLYFQVCNALVLPAGGAGKSKFSRPAACAGSCESHQWI